MLVLIFLFGLHAIAAIFVFGILLVNKFLRKFKVPAVYCWFSRAISIVLIFVFCTFLVVKASAFLVICMVSGGMGEIIDDRDCSKLKQELTRMNFYTPVNTKTIKCRLHKSSDGEKYLETVLVFPANETNDFIVKNNFKHPNLLANEDFKLKDEETGVWYISGVNPSNTFIGELNNLDFHKVMDTSLNGKTPFYSSGFMLYGINGENNFEGLLRIKY